MGLFNIFSKKENKADLDKGLEKTKEGVFSKLARAVAGKSKVDEEVLDNLEEILISSDVGVDTTVRIIERIEQRVAADKYMNTAELNAILREEITDAGGEPRRRRRTVVREAERAAVRSDGRRRQRRGQDHDDR